MPDTDTASPVDTQLLTHRAVRSAGQSPGRSWRDVLPIHPAAALFPRMSRNELQALADDISKNGLQMQITVMHECDGETGERSYLLLDGRDRLDAIELAGFNPIAPERRYHVEGRDCGLDLFLGLPDGEIAINYIDPPDDPYAFVASVNIHRRHLTAEQKRDLIAKLLKVQPEKSNRQIAKLVNASPTTVGTKRAEMEATGDVSKLDTRTDSKGRKQPARRTTTKPPPVSEEVLQQRAAATERIRALMGGKTRDDIGPVSNDEITRKDARIEELEADKRRLEIENIGLPSEFEETKAVRKPEGEGEGSELGNLLRAWDRASQGAREKFKARLGLVAVEPPAKAMDDGLDIPECLRRAAP